MKNSKKTIKMDTATEARNELAKLYGEIKSGRIDLPTATRLHQNVGRQVDLVGQQLRYSQMRKAVPNIKFLNC